MKSNSKEYSLSSIDAFVAQEFVSRMSHTTIFALQGPLGAGKTTITKSFLRQLGVLEPILSPTFAYVNIYKVGSDRVLYHFDLYRITSQNQFFELGFDEYLLTKNALSIIEWPEVISPFLRSLEKKSRVCFIRLEYPDSIEKGLEGRVAYFE